MNRPAEQDAYVAGVRYDYRDLELDEDACSAEAKAAELQDGDEIQFVADHYTEAGEYEDTYKIGEPITYRLLIAAEKADPNDPDGADRADFVPEGNLIVGYTDLGEMKDDLVATYLFTDIYDQEYWTAPMANVPLAD